MREQRRVLVTGASGGIGQAIARELAAAGFSLGLHCRRGREAVEQLAAELRASGTTAGILQFDIGEREPARIALEADMAENGPYWGAVCNAGYNADNTFPALTGEQWDGVIDSHLHGFYNVLQPLIMPLVRLRAGGRIVTIASVAGLIGNRGQSNYSAAKAGLIGASKALAVEMASRRITVNCVAPGLIDTGMLNNAPVAEILKHIPLGRAGTPAEVAALVGFLFRDEAAYITRQVLSVNGGLC